MNRDKINYQELNFASGLSKTFKVRLFHRKRYTYAGCLWQNRLYYYHINIGYIITV